MNDSKIPTPIIDRNGKATTVWKKVEPALSGGERISAAASGFGRTKGNPILTEDEKDVLFENVHGLRPRNDESFLDKTGFDKEFDIEFTESYGFDTPKDSINRMRSDDMGIERLTEDFTYNGKTRSIHFVGTNLDNKVAQFQSWIDSGANSFDSNTFAVNFEGAGTEVESKTQAWLSVSGDLAWTFDEDIADRLINGITPY